MIIAVVAFELPPGSQRADAIALYQGSAPAWAGNPDLLEKHYFFDADTGRGGGVYHWRSRDAARRWLGDDYVRMIRERYRTVPRIEMFEAVLHVDTATRKIAEVQAGAAR
jgi:hypothetical protein